jgi:acid phosphatase type 7
MPTPTAAHVNEVTVVGAGDISCGADSTLSTDGCEQGATQNLLLSLNPDRILPLGDNQYEKGSLSDYNTYFDPTWGLFKSKISPIVGNHEYQTSGAAGYFDYFNGPGSTTGPAGDRTKGYYSYNLGNWHLIAVNSNCDKVGGCGPGSPEYTWLQNDLATDTHTCTLMYMHHPFIASDRRNYDIAPAYQPFYELFYAAGGEVVLSGHSHFYERFARLNSLKQADPDYGFRQFVAGTGGRSTQWFIEIRPYSEVHAGRLFGLIKLSLRQNDYSWEFVTTPGYSFTDSGTETCHGPHP